MKQIISILFLPFLLSVLYCGFFSSFTFINWSISMLYLTDLLRLVYTCFVQQNTKNVQSTFHYPFLFQFLQFFEVTLYASCNTQFYPSPTVEKDLV